MAGLLQSFLDRVNQTRSLRRWSKLADACKTAPLFTLRAASSQAWVLRRHLDRVIHQAEYRLALPTMGTNIIRRPMGTDWAWRPELWRGPVAVIGHASLGSRTALCDGATIYHDCKRSEITARQIRNSREADIAPFGLRMDVFRFDGSFLSLALDFPPEAVRGLKQKHILRVDVIAEMKKPLEIFARLNIKHGPNTETIVREMPLNEEEVMVEFDLGFSKINEKRIEKIWLDLIFEGPEMNQIILRDVTLTRRPAQNYKRVKMATLTKTRLRAGVWQGILTLEAGEKPEIDVLHLEAPVQGVTITAITGKTGEFAVLVPIPLRALMDGVQTFVIQNRTDMATLASFCIVTGSPLETDLRAAIDLLRAELDLLKRAFRRHCVESA